MLYNLEKDVGRIQKLFQKSLERPCGYLCQMVVEIKSYEKLLPRVQKLSLSASTSLSKAFWDYVRTAYMTFVKS